MKEFISKANTSTVWRLVWALVFALLVPLSLLSILGSLLSLSMVMGDWSTLSEAIRMGSAMAFMVLAATYWITYIVALIVVLVRKKIGWAGLLPVFHIVLFGLSLLLNTLVG